jgi:hypothetical protein
MKTCFPIGLVVSALLGLMPAGVAAANGSAAADMTRSYIKARAACDRNAITDCCRDAKAATRPSAGTCAEASRCCRLPARSEIPGFAVARGDGSCRSACVAMR